MVRFAQKIRTQIVQNKENGYQLLFFVLCVILGVMIIAQWNVLQLTEDAEFVKGKNIEELRQDYIVLEDNNKFLLERVRVLERVFEDIQTTDYDQADLTALLESERDLLRRFSGMDSVSGEGIIIYIEVDDEFPISSNMLLQLVNELRASDALAIAVNGQRLTAQTEIRDTVTGFAVNRMSFSYAEPVVVTAIGDGVDLYNALSMIGGIIDRWTESHIDVSVDIVENLIVAGLADWQIEYMFLPEDYSFAGGGSE